MSSIYFSNHNIIICEPKSSQIRQSFQLSPRSMGILYLRFGKKKYFKRKKITFFAISWGNARVS